MVEYLFRYRVSARPAISRIYNFIMPSFVKQKLLVIIIIIIAAVVVICICTTLNQHPYQLPH